MTVFFSHPERSEGSLAGEPGLPYERFFATLRMTKAAYRHPIFSTMRNFALREREFSFISISVAIIGFFVIGFSPA